MPLPPQPPPVRAPDPAAAVEEAFLEAFDDGQAAPEATAPRGPARLALSWLAAAAAFRPGHELPPIPFKAGRELREARALHRLLKAPPEARLVALQSISLGRAGTALALWRWGQAQVRAGAFTQSQRQAWEDRLLAAGPEVTRGYALRHALCWALAERDEARFAALSPRLSGSDDLRLALQRAFGLLDGRSPSLRLWRLPDLAYQDARLDELGVRRLWVCPAEPGTPAPLPAGTGWIIPSPKGGQEPREATLSHESALEARELAVLAAGGPAWFAPSRAALEPLGLLWFPVLVDLDGEGRIQSVRMGDAAPTRP